MLHSMIIGPSSGLSEHSQTSTEIWTAVLARRKFKLRLFGILFICTNVAAQAPIPPLTPPEKTEANRLFGEIRTNSRGPYGTIHWYCRDGRVLPVDTPCGGKGGFQHASPGRSAERLAQLNFDVAQMLAGLPFEEFLDEKRNHFRTSGNRRYQLPHKSGKWVDIREDVCAPGSPPVGGRRLRGPPAGRRTPSPARVGEPELSCWRCLWSPIRRTEWRVVVCARFARSQRRWPMVIHRFSRCAERFTRSPMSEMSGGLNNL